MLCARNSRPGFADAVPGRGRVRQTTPPGGAVTGLRAIWTDCAGVRPRCRCSLLNLLCTASRVGRAKAQRDGGGSGDPFRSKSERPHPASLTEAAACGNKEPRSYDRHPASGLHDCPVPISKGGRPHMKRSTGSTACSSRQHWGFTPARQSRTRPRGNAPRGPFGIVRELNFTDYPNAASSCLSQHGISSRPIGGDESSWRSRPDRWSRR